MFKACKKYYFNSLAMKIKLTVRQKITIFILSIAISLFVITIGYFSTTAQRSAIKNITEATKSYTDHYAILIENWLNSDMAVVKTLSSAFLENKQLPFEQWSPLVLAMYKQVIIVNPHIDAIWDSWEFSYLDPTWTLPYGRWLHIYYRDKAKGQLLSKFEKRSLEGDPPTYGYLKAAGRESIVEPYTSVLQKGGLMTSLASPMFIGGKYIGLVGIDLFLGRFQNLINDIKPYDQAQSFLLSNKGIFVAHPDTSIFKKKLEDIYPELNQSERILEKISKGEKFSFTATNSDGERLFYSFSPVNVGQTKTPWSLGMVVPEKVMLRDSNRSYNIGLLVGVFGVVILILAIFFLVGGITRPIKGITKLLDELAQGKIDKSMHISVNTGDEIAKMGDALSKSIDGLLAKTEFARSIGDGKLDAELNLLSEDDVLGKSLLDMRESLKRAEQEETKRKEEDEKRRWINEGLAKFGDILRQNNNNMSILGTQIINNLVWYLNANLGGIFVKNEGNSPVTYDLSSAFAYDRNRLLKKSFEIGEGLIGACVAERGTIYLKEVPEDYVEITSGLGDANPNNLLITPLIIDDEVLGVIELASLKYFKDFEIEFVEKLGQSIASTLRTVRINQKTSELLQHTQEQTEVMITQEEEMRQNLEELQATQEEAARKAFEMEGILGALNASNYVVEYDPTGVIININDAYLKLLGISRDEAIGVHHSHNLVMTEEQRLNYDQFWANLRKGEMQKQNTKVLINGKEHAFIENYSPIRSINGDVYKILKVAIDVTTLG
jgi:PAS domain S-box-containing protein